ncbi:ATP-dependent DNA ligase [Amycolatopsis antarctica]|uniref:ATP-dependent DNA ligase n=1 Tax=Amycolatopsis antarctica TaxID=1854586 RepID=A0A263D1G7_9PSEU|nr:DNA polymerase ligase N-terminal domain-containing protein [Amycolatopsis antarctica]OZM71948.1 ATP-dependent DNA ligase [Amycolatopsis antarctica]
MSDPLDEYRRKRDGSRTPEPVPEGPTAIDGDDSLYVIQEHHASQLHWDVRFERGGVLVSWAVPLGLPVLPETARLAVHTEDHPREYATFEGEIPAGEYGAGVMTIWDTGTYETLHWNDHMVEVVLHGARISGRYAFVNRHDEDSPGWLVRRIDPAPDGWTGLPGFVPPARTRPGRMAGTRTENEWAYSFDWGGLRAQARVQGGRVTLHDRDGVDVSGRYHEVKALGATLGSTELLLDGELLVFDQGRPSAAGLHRRAHASPAQAKRLVGRFPVVYVIYDVLHHEGRSCLGLPYRQRRELLGSLGLEGPNWTVPEDYTGDGPAVLAAATEHGLPGVVRKRLDGEYRPDGDDWIAVPADG